MRPGDAGAAANPANPAPGRLIRGVGIGADNPAVRAEFHAAGVPFEARLGRALEDDPLVAERTLDAYLGQYYFRLPAYDTATRARVLRGHPAATELLG